jgi:hypothetical protein
VLIRVAVTPHGTGRTKLCTIDLGFRDHLTGGETKEKGQLDLEISAQADVGDLDPTVEVRVQRSETSVALARANDVFVDGKANEALKLLDAQATALENQRKRWAARQLSPDPSLVKDLADQTEIVDSTRKQYRQALASSKPAEAWASPAAAPARRSSVEKADAYAF